MKLQKSPNRWSCLPTAFAMITGWPVSVVVDQIGHDGSEIIWPENPEPLCRRGFHIQEIINVAFHHGMTMTPHEPLPMIVSGTGKPHQVSFEQPPENRMEYIMRYSYGVIIGKLHAVAWDGEQILDPNGTRYDISEFTVECFWLIR